MRPMSGLKAACLAAVAAFALASQGCLKTTQVFTIYPDSSGKCEITVTLLGRMAEAVKSGASGEEDPKEGIKEALKGKVYWDSLEAKEDVGGSYTIRGVGYFENIKDLEDQSVTFEKDGAGYKFTLVQKDGAMPGLGGGEGGMPGMGEAQTPEQKEQQKAMIGMMMAGLEVKTEVRMPGSVAAVEGFSAHEGRSASFKLADTDLLKMIDSGEKPPTKFVATCGADADGLQAEWDAFKKKLAELKAAAPKEDAEPKEEGEAPAEKKEGDSDF